MCGIAGIFSYRDSAPVDRRQLRRMIDRIQRRGPDGEGEWYSKPNDVGFGHRRLAIIDLSEGGAQPMCSADGTSVITFNGEIYNYRELRRELQFMGCELRSTSDTEVLLHLYQRFGADMLRRLRGMYAFAIWDEEKQGIFLARDPFGIKPLYYSDSGKAFFFASQVKAVLASEAFTTSPDPAGHVGFFLWGHIPEPFTLYKQIRALPAGHTVWIDKHGVHAPQPFGRICDIVARGEAAAGKLQYFTKEEAAEYIHEKLADSVRSHLVADVPVGVFLSSGLDSTTIAALARETGGDLRTVTLSFEEFKGSERDEAPLAEAVAERYGAQHQTISVRREDFSANFERLFHAMDQPTIDGVNSFFVSHAAHQAGLKVALSGVGGDELFGGYSTFTDVPRAVRWMRPLRPIPLLGSAVRTVTAPIIRRMTSPKYAGILEYGPSYGGAYLLRRGMFMPWELTTFLEPELVRTGWRELETLTNLESSHTTVKNPHLKVTALETQWYMRNQLLRDADWSSMDFSLEVRTPLVDVDLLRSLAPLYANGFAITKKDMASSPERSLPDKVLHKKKTGFSIPVREWLGSLPTAELEGDAFSATRNDARAQRGLRGWSKIVYAQATQTSGSTRLSK